MAYFDKDKETSIIVDTSPVGISDIVSQNTPGQNDNKIISYASRSLTDPERNIPRLKKRPWPLYGQWNTSMYFCMVTSLVSSRTINRRKLFPGYELRKPLPALSVGSCDFSLIR